MPYPGNGRFLTKTPNLQCEFGANVSVVSLLCRLCGIPCSRLVILMHFLRLWQLSEGGSHRRRMKRWCCGADRMSGFNDDSPTVLTEDNADNLARLTTAPTGNYILSSTPRMSVVFV